MKTVVEIRRPERFAVPEDDGGGPKEPKILQQAEETLKWLEEVHGWLGRIRAKLDGSQTCDQIERPFLQGLGDMLSRASSDAASLVGDARTIDGLLGERP